jgi:GNAT superfamily N-acetyltransferase
MPTPITLQRAKEADLPWINAQYATVPFRPTTVADKVLIAYNSNTDEQVGLGRLIPLASSSASTQDDDESLTASAFVVSTLVWELGGIYVQPAYRGQGLARRIVQGLLDLAAARDDGLETPTPTTITTIWCLPFAHLLPFYTSFGFEAVSRCSPQVPATIRTTLGDCCTAFPDRGVGLLRMELAQQKEQPLDERTYVK